MTAATALKDPSHYGRPADAEEAADQRAFVTFDIGNQIFAADVADVREILDHQQIAPLPNASAALLGMIDLRGEGIAVMDLALSLGLSRLTDERAGRIIVLDLQTDRESAVAIMVDRVRTVVEVAEEAVDPVPSVPGGWNAGAMFGVTRVEGELVYLIDLQSALGHGGAADLPGPFDFE
jgi:purine-binding chemotaxis protein CheW